MRAHPGAATEPVLASVSDDPLRAGPQLGLVALLERARLDHLDGDGVPVESNVVQHERVAELGFQFVDERFTELVRQPLEIRREDHRLEELARARRCRRLGLEPAVADCEPGRLEPRARLLDRRVVPEVADRAQVVGVRLPARELGAERASPLDVALAAALRHELGAGAQRGPDSREQRFVVEDVMEGGCRDRRVHGGGQ